MNSSHEILHSILAARRLLSDHVDILQLALADSTPPPPSCSPLHLTRTSLQVALSVGTVLTGLAQHLRLSTPACTLICLGGSSGATYSLHQLLGIWQRRRQVRQTVQLLASLDGFDTALRQRIKYFREANCLQSGGGAASTLKAQQRQEQLAAELTATVAQSLPVIWATFAVIQRIEQLPLSAGLASVYLPTESLDNCALLRRPTEAADGAQPPPQYSLQDVRDAHEIFQFLQSQLLLRLGLATLCNAHEAPRLLAGGVRDLCGVLDAQRRRFVDEQALRAQLDRVRERLEATHQSANRQPLSGEQLALRALRHVTLDVLGRMLALTEELRGVDAVLQRAVGVRDAEVLEIGGDVERLGDRFEACRDEYRRVVCTYQRAVLGRVEVQAAAKVEPVEAVSGKEVKTAVRVFDDAEQLGNADAEFYAVVAANRSSDSDGSEDDEAAMQSQRLDVELQSLNATIAKRQFRPVLRQLRDRLEPINEAMRQRERKYFADKGIEMEEGGDEQLGQRSEAESSSDDEEESARRRPIRKDAYADMRQFLQDKLPMGFGMGFALPQRGVMDEEVLE